MEPQEQGLKRKIQRIAPAGSEEAKKYGRTFSEEEKKSLSEKNKIAKASYVGVARDEETKRKISEAKTGVALNAGAKAKILAAQGKKVKMIGLDGKETIFLSQGEAGKATGISGNTIAQYCKGKSKNKSGLIFTYVQ